MALAITPGDVAAFAPGAPTVTTGQIEEALDWAEILLEGAHVTLASGSREERAARRAVCAYAISLATRGTVRGAVMETGRVLKLKDGAEEITFADRDGAALAELPGDWEAQAWQSLYAAGVPRPRPAVGASR